MWKLGAGDLPWLYTDLEYRLSIDDKRIALSAIVWILSGEQALEKEKEALYQRSQNFPLLVEDLDNYLKPREEYDCERESRLNDEQYTKQQRDKEPEEKASWLKFRNELTADPHSK